MQKIRQFIEQFSFFIEDYKSLSGSKKLRMLYLWLNRVSVGLFFYRFDRAFYLLFGRAWSVLRLPLYPVFMLVEVYSNIDISYKANIGPSITILHAAMGVVISGYAKIGKNCTLVGGNVIGGKLNIKEKPFILGDNVSLGANAVILGPCNIADNTVIGACALVIEDTQKSAIMVGVPAKNIKKDKTSE